MGTGGEAAELAPGSNNSMTGNEKRHRIAPARLTHRPSCLRPSEPSGNLSIGSHSTGRNLPKVSPDLQLKGSSLEVDWMIERAKVTGEVSLQRFNSGGQGATAFPELHGAMAVVEVSQ
ncbi:MAG: hypothetical protein H6Q51_676 [Deltaproteobacteria bacterium]|nr:hypothetical protein [Deltaproteobacteria bacterium]